MIRLHRILAIGLPFSRAALWLPAAAHLATGLHAQTFTWSGNITATTGISFNDGGGTIPLR